MPVQTPQVRRPTVWAVSISLAATLKIDVSFSSSGYLDVSVHRVPSITLCIHVNVIRLLVPGFPIRKSMDQSLFTAHHGLSQLTTSFIGSWCQGIHPTLLLAWFDSLLDPHSCMSFSALLKLQISVNLHYLRLFSFLMSFFSANYFSICSFQGAWWAQVDSNHRPHAYQACALTCWAMSPRLRTTRRIPSLHSFESLVLDCSFLPH